MSSDKTEFIVSTGIFHDKGDPEGIIVYPEEGALVSLSALLNELIGRHVDVSLHYFPPSGKFDVSKPGAGCCLLAEHCRAGHVQNPRHLFSTSLSGVLSRNSDGTWLVNSTVIPLSDQMDGHYGRFALFARGEIRKDLGVESLLQESSALLELLTSLRGTLKRTS